MSALAQCLGISRPAATGLIDRLIAQGLVQRENVEEDRRTIKVSITPKGKKIVVNIWEQKRRTLIKVFSKLSARDRKEHLLILERVVHILAQQQGSKNPKVEMKRIPQRFFILIVLSCLVFFSPLENKKIFAAKAVGDVSSSPNSSSNIDFSPANSVSLSHDTLTLQDCYQLALKQSEKVAIQQQMIKEAEARFQRSLGGILPHTTFEISDKRQNGSNSNNFSLSEIPENKFIFSQPLFSGFKDFASMAANRAERRQRIQETRRAQQLLFTDVSDAFYLFLNYQEDIAALSTTQKALNDRMEELRRREALGRSRPSEIASAEVLLNRNEAEIASVQSQMEVSRELLEFLTGHTIEKVKDFNEEFMKEEFMEDVSLQDQDDYVKRADNRPDVLASKEALTAVQKKIAVARSGWWPSAGLNGDYYTKRVGNSGDVTWDFTFQVDVPIFDGGETLGQVQEAKAQANEAGLVLKQTQRNAVLEIQNATSRFQTALKRRNALKKALDSAERNYQLQKEDYQRSLVNNLDVLQALQDLQSVRRDFITASFDVKRMYWGLQVAVGEIPIE